MEQNIWNGPPEFELMEAIRSRRPAVFTRGEESMRVRIVLSSRVMWCEPKGTHPEFVLFLVGVWYKHGPNTVVPAIDKVVVNLRYNVSRKEAIVITPEQCVEWSHILNDEARQRLIELATAHGEGCP